jgi:hypothetical protein
VAVFAGCNTINDPISTSTPGAVGQVTMTISQGNHQTAIVGQQVGVPPTIHIEDALHTAQVGVTVTFTVVSGGGSIVQEVQTTNDGGSAHPVSWTLGTSPGTNTLKATAANVSGSPITFTATAVAASAPSSVRR